MFYMYNVRNFNRDTPRSLQLTFARKRKESRQYDMLMTRMFLARKVCVFVVKGDTCKCGLTIDGFYLI